MARRRRIPPSPRSSVRVVADDEALPVDAPYLLMTRTEDERGHGGWVATGVADTNDAEAVAAALNADLRAIGSALRCTMIPNTGLALQALMRQEARRLGRTYPSQEPTDVAHPARCLFCGAVRYPGCRRRIVVAASRTGHDR